MREVSARCVSRARAKAARSGRPSDVASATSGGAQREQTDGEPPVEERAQREREDEARGVRGRQNQQQLDDKAAHRGW